jgi:alginate O-acetyltransferase complex protein AlgI
MIFNSFNFLIFFTAVFVLFFFLKGPGRKVLLFVSSSVFYMWFIPQYILILYLTIGIDYFAAIQIEKSTDKKHKKLHLIIGIVNTCLVLSVFKYCNFFIDNLNFVGFKSIRHWDIILPIGLSFHVFQSLSYVIEVYQGNIKAEKNLLVYSNFVMMFPQLVAGPIERANNLIPQLKKCDHEITYNDFSIGFSRFFWGLFKKVIVADTASVYVDSAYNNYTAHSGSTLLLATFFFAIQIYCDFSGYSDMAIGVARMLGFKFKENFAIPYFSKSITEFWRRWHMSLSSWLRDYLYISFGGNRKGKFFTYRNLLLTMLIGGLWHGASWNFIIWGGLNGLYLALEKAFRLTLNNPDNLLVKLIRCVYVFVFISLSWVFFRAGTFNQAIVIIKKIITNFNIKGLQLFDVNVVISIITSIIVLIILEYFVFRKYSFEKIFNYRYGDFYMTALTTFLILYIIVLGNSNGAQFIYFQF